MEKNKNKYDFILELIESKKLKSYQKEKVLKLALIELQKDPIKNDDIIKRIERLEQKLDLKIKEKEGNDSNSNTSKLLEYKSPKDLYKFLQDYNQDPILKYTCHEIDDIDIINDINKKCNTNQYSLIKHQNLILTSFKKLTKKHVINKNVYSLIEKYINGGDGIDWSSDKIKTNWKSTELSIWSNDNPSVPPNIGINLQNYFKKRGPNIKPFKSKLTNERVNTFSKLVLHFKHMFHIKADNTLKKLLEIQNDKSGWNEKIEFKINNNNFWENIELFTDIDKLIQAYRKIIMMILEASNEKPIVKLGFKEEGNHVIFSIHHKNTVFKKTSKNIINRLGEQHISLIKNQINGLCDLYLIADFGHNHYAKINLWNDQERTETLIDTFEGVKHNLIFNK